MRTGIPFFGLTPPCNEWIEDERGGYYARIPTDECYKMLPPQRWKGLWRNAFEGSQFCPAPAKECQHVPPALRSEPYIWLNSSYSWPAEARKRVEDEAVYEIEFIGRRTMYQGRYGHLGGADHEVIVDRLISLRKAPEKK